jgi:hypothetical protein
VYYTGNYVSLLPGESRTLGIEADGALLDGDSPLVAVDGWNTTVAAQSFPGGGGSAVAPNAEARVDPSAAPTFSYQRVPVKGSGF